MQGIIEIDLIAIRSSSRVALDIKTDLQHSGSAAETGRPSCHWATGPLSKSADGLIETREVALSFSDSFGEQLAQIDGLVISSET